MWQRTLKWGSVTEATTNGAVTEATTYNPSQGNKASFSKYPRRTLLSEPHATYSRTAEDPSPAPSDSRVDRMLLCADQSYDSIIEASSRFYIKQLETELHSHSLNGDLSPDIESLNRDQTMQIQSFFLIFNQILYHILIEQTSQELRMRILSLWFTKLEQLIKNISLLHL